MHHSKITDISNNGDLVAQLVEQYTFNVWVLGSNPSQVTKKTISLRGEIGRHAILRGWYPKDVLVRIQSQTPIRYLFIHIVDLVAQLVEQYTFNVWVLGSNPSQVTKVKTIINSNFFHINIL